MASEIKLKSCAIMDLQFCRIYIFIFAVQWRCWTGRAKASCRLRNHSLRILLNEELLQWLLLACYWSGVQPAASHWLSAARASSLHWETRHGSSHCRGQAPSAPPGECAGLNARFQGRVNPQATTRVDACAKFLHDSRQNKRIRPQPFNLWLHIKEQVWCVRISCFCRHLVKCVNIIGLTLNRP